MAKGIISKDVAKGLMNDTAQFVISDLDLKDITTYFRDAFQEIKKDSDSNCPLQSVEDAVAASLKISREFPPLSLV